MSPLLLLLPVGLVLAAAASRRPRSKLASAPAPSSAGPPFPAPTGGYWHEVEPTAGSSFALPYAMLFAVSAPAADPTTPQLIAWIAQQGSSGQFWQLQTFAPGAALPPDWPSALDPPTLTAFRASGVVAAPSGLAFIPGGYRTFVWSSRGGTA